MIIRKILIENFRCYYGETIIELSEGLNLFIGDNGDGKTTLIEALEWLFDTSVDKMDQSLISRKKQTELGIDEVGTVSVSMDFEHDGEKSITKSFDFRRNGDNMDTFNYKFDGLESNQVEREPISGAELLDRCFDASVRQYSLFKGEEELDVFQNQNALQYLVNTFSNVRNFNPYISFWEFASDESQKALRKAVRLDKGNIKKERDLSQQIDSHIADMHNIKKKITEFENESRRYSEFIADYEYNREASEGLNIINTRLRAKKDNLIRVQNTIKENYSTRLLDDEWILCGMPSIFEEFQQRVSSASKLRRKEEAEAIKKQGKDEVIKELNESIAQGITPLSITIPDEATMKEMLDDEFCKVCGRKAEKGSDPYLFMKEKLDKLIESNLPKKKSEIKEYFTNNFVGELEQRRVSMAYEKARYAQLSTVIKEDIQFNKERKAEETNLKNEIYKIEDDKIKLLSSVGNFSEQDLENIHINLANWYRRKNDAEKQMPQLESKLLEIISNLNQAKREYNELATDSAANIFQKINSVFDIIRSAFERAKDKNIEEFLTSLGEEANSYFSKLNVEDFHGIINISKDYGSARLMLTDNSNRLVYNPSQSQLTTMRMSVLFAISKLTTLKRENDYPLIFDAPTSSFGVVKERDFFNLITEIDKQCVIFTKNFIEIDENTGAAILNRKAIDNMNARVYRMKKREPFNNQDLSTIQTDVTLIKH